MSWLGLEFICTYTSHFAFIQPKYMQNNYFNNMIYLSIMSNFVGIQIKIDLKKKIKTLNFSSLSIKKQWQYVKTSIYHETCKNVQ